jgi:hypothetical protein
MVLVQQIHRVPTTRAFVGSTIRAVKLLIRDGRIPKPLRWGGSLGLLPLSGPLDEAVLLLVGAILLALLPRPAPRSVDASGGAESHKSKRDLVTIDLD